MSVVPQIIHYPFDRALTSTKAGAPLVTDDVNSGFDTGHILIDTSASPFEVWISKDSTAGAADWEKVTTNTAAEVSYDNGTSGLAATDVQAAVDELSTGGLPTTATGVSYVNGTSGLTATNVQAALDEIDGNLDDVIDGTTDITFVSTTDLTSVTVEAAINEVANDSGKIVYSPATSSLTATRVQGALDQAADAENTFIDTTASALTSNRVEAAVNELANDSGLMAYSNTVSGLQATTVKAALDELARARVISTPGDASLVTLDTTQSDIVIINTSTQAVTVNLPAISGLGGVARRYVIKDSGNATVNNITISPNGSETIEGMATALIRTNYTSLTVVANAAATPDDWLVI